MNKPMQLYAQDYAQWAETMADLLERGKFQELDIYNLVEEIRDLSKRERDHLLSSISLILQHFLTWDYQPERRCVTWQITIRRERLHINDYLGDSPSLRQYLSSENRYYQKIYLRARLDAIAETNDELAFPEQCPYSIEDVMHRVIELDKN